MQPAKLDFASLRSAYASGSETPATIVRRVYDRIAARGDDGVWLALRPIEDVLAEADRLAAMGPGERAAKPLWGLPFGIKDSIDYAGLPTTAGCPDYA